MAKVCESSTTMREIDMLVENASRAANEFLNFNQGKVDIIVEKVRDAAVESSVMLAKMAIEETNRGVFQDKVSKNLFAAKNVFDSIKNQKTVGIVGESEDGKVISVAEPFGIIAGITPVTNPTSTTIFKILIALKTRNAIIFAFHPNAQKCSEKAAQTLYDAAIRCGAPENCIQWIKKPSINATMTLINHPKVALSLATGGPNMVKSAYSCGKPALGVGPGNVPCYIDESADLRQACDHIIMSKTFDNGMICASEQSLVLHSKIAEKFKKIMTKSGCYILNSDETLKLSKFIWNAEKNMLNPAIVGQNAEKIARMSDIKVQNETKILIAEINGIGKNYPLSCEKLSPILSLFVVDDVASGIEICNKILNFGGLGHSASLHCSLENKKLIADFSNQIKASRILVNTPSSQGAIGGLFNELVPSLTLGCGSYGKNSTSDNISAKNLLNIKKVAFNEK